MNTPTHEPAILGCWNYYVESGETKEERARRLALCPDSLRVAVESHVRTAFQVRRVLKVPASGGSDRTGADTQRSNKESFA